MTSLGLAGQGRASPLVLPSVFHNHNRPWPVGASARAAAKSCVNIGEAVTHRYVEWLDNTSATGASGQTRRLQTDALPHSHSHTHMLVHSERWEREKGERGDKYVYGKSMM